MIGNAIRSPLLMAPAPGPTPTPADKEPQAGGAAHPFAEMLRQNRLAEAPPAAQAPKASAPAEVSDRPAAGNGDDGSEPAAPGTPSSQRDAILSKARSVGASRAVTRSTAPTARSTAAAESSSATKDESTTASTKASADALVPQSPAGISRPELGQGPDANAGDRVGGTISGAHGANGTTRSLDAANDAEASGASALGASTTGTAASGATESRRGALAAATDAAAENKAMLSASDEHASASSSFAEALAETRTQQHSAASPIEGPGHGAAGLAAALAEPTHDVAQGANTAVATSTVPVPVDSPDFAAAFGLQVSTLARDGVQRAELHLNPTDMGPVSIQITLDGTQARVDFGADVAATRHAIETGLPELASALRDAGFTLAGGGVTQHSHSNGGQTDDANPGSSGSRRSAPEAIARLDAAAQRVTRRIAAGGVDLYA
jgi:flagellar hook-length control protein FliK